MSWKSSDRKDEGWERKGTVGTQGQIHGMLEWNMHSILIFGNLLYVYDIKF